MREADAGLIAYPYSTCYEDLLAQGNLQASGALQRSLVDVSVGLSQPATDPPRLLRMLVRAIAQGQENP
jgi:hypothetical protein